MKILTLGIFSVLSLMLATLNMGCEPYHRHGVGIEVDIHSKGHRDHRKDNDDHRDHDDHHDH